MRIKVSVFGMLLWFFSAALLALEPGDAAPEFALEGTDGRVHSLTDYIGRQAVVLAWFPRAYTRGCTIECASLAKNGHLIREFDVAYFMASVDPLEDNSGFAAEQKADFPLLSDPDKSTARAYDVLALAGYAKRHTIYIGIDGRVLYVDRDVQPATSAEDMAAHLERLGIAKRAGTVDTAATAVHP